MKSGIFLALFAIFLGAIRGTSLASPLGASPQLLEYQIHGNEYAVVVVQEGEMTEAEAFRMAKEAAARSAKEHGYPFFRIEQEQKIQVLKADQTNQLYGNMYQEMIIEGRFERERMGSQPVPNSRLIPAVRLVFRGYPQKPRGESIDVCDVIDCDSPQKKSQD